MRSRSMRVGSLSRRPAARLVGEGPQSSTLSVAVTLSGSDHTICSASVATMATSRKSYPGIPRMS